MVYNASSSIGSSLWCKRVFLIIIRGVFLTFSEYRLIVSMFFPYDEKINEHVSG